MKSVIGGVSAAALLLASAAGAAEPARVKIDSGALVGVADGGVQVFRGVPFAKPVVGALRWQPPQRPDPWSGDKDATRSGLPCPQPMNADGSPNGGGAKGPYAEDCLTLNVFAPKNARNAPVMVWLYGGAGYLGDGSLPTYDGSAFARDGVVVVTINYRLGMLGNFAHPALSKAAKPGEPLANYALMDAIAALEWVQRNAAAFGGDKNNVTLFGQSAGGAMVSSLLSSPAAKGLFHKAIVQSGASLDSPLTLAQGEEAGVKTAAALGLAQPATAADLRAVPADKIVATQAARQGVRGVRDGKIKTVSTREALTNHTDIDVPIIVGSNSGENASAGAKALADLAAGGKGAAWQYFFTYVPDWKQTRQPQGAVHSDEIPFVYSTLRNSSRLGPNTTPKDQAVADQVHSCWVAFAKMPAASKTISCAGGFNWPAHTPENDTVALFGDTPSLGKAAPIVAKQQADAAAQRAR